MMVDIQEDCSSSVEVVGYYDRLAAMEMRCVSYFSFCRCIYIVYIASQLYISLYNCPLQYINDIFIIFRRINQVMNISVAQEHTIISLEALVDVLEEKIETLRELCIEN